MLGKRLNSLNKALKAFSRKLGRIPSFGFALLYLLLIPFFAIIYYFSPNHFYHQTVQFEHSMHNDAQLILNDLGREIVATFKREHNSDEVAVNGWRVRADSLSVQNLKVSPGELGFQIEAILTADNQRLFAAATIKGPLRDWAEGKPTKGQNDDDVIEYRTMTAEASPSSRFSTDQSLATSVFPAKRPNMAIVAEKFGPKYAESLTGKLIVPVSRRLNDKILDYQKGTEGFPAALSGNFVRMFYLSASTITTLGYGDILPITTLALKPA